MTDFLDITLRTNGEDQSRRCRANRRDGLIARRSRRCATPDVRDLLKAGADKSPSTRRRAAARLRQGGGGKSAPMHRRRHRRETHQLPPRLTSASASNGRPPTPTPDPLWKCHSRWPARRQVSTRSNGRADGSVRAGRSSSPAWIERHQGRLRPRTHRGDAMRAGPGDRVGGVGTRHIYAGVTAEAPKAALAAVDLSLPGIHRAPVQGTLLSRVPVRL